MKGSLCSDENVFRHLEATKFASTGALGVLKTQKCCDFYSSPCHRKGGGQKGIGKKLTKNVKENDKKVTKR